MGSLLFPDPPRDFTGRRALKITLRAAHVLCAGTLFAVYLFDVDPQRTAWLLAALGTGLLILLLDLYESAAFLLQVRGLVVLGKITLVALLPWLGTLGVWVLGFLVVLSVLSSHAPGSIRHRVVFGAGRIRGGESRG